MPGIEELTPEEIRESFEKLNAHKKLPGVDRTKIQVPVVNVPETWVYTPTGAKGPLPYIFYLHGGGFMAGSMEMYDGLATDLVLRTGYALVFPVYKLAPEAKWPEQQDQCFAVLEWLTQNGACHNLVTDRFALMGDSAGGILIFNLNVMAQQKCLTVPYNIILSPMGTLDYVVRKPTASVWEFWNGPFLTAAAMRKFVDAYAPLSGPGSVDRGSELASPAFNMSDAVAGRFAPTLIVTSSADVLRDEGEAMGERLQKAGRDVAVLRAHGQAHDPCAIELIRPGPTPRMIMTLVTAALKERLG
ncbi:lipase 2 [Apiospora kogelbergensis]|uniref:lipase 2 n=1 Tax=Apiospora kogelbergensis TaxID=1337665 RepID=UPI00312CC863